MLIFAVFPTESKDSPEKAAVWPEKKSRLDWGQINWEKIVRRKEVYLMYTTIAESLWTSFEVAIIEFLISHRGEPLQTQRGPYSDKLLAYFSCIARLQDRWTPEQSSWSHPERMPAPSQPVCLPFFPMKNTEENSVECPTISPWLGAATWSGQRADLEAEKTSRLSVSIQPEAPSRASMLR